MRFSRSTASMVIDFGIIVGLHFAAGGEGSVKRFFLQQCVLAVQGHLRSLILARIENEYATS